MSQQPPQSLIDAFLQHYSKFFASGSHQDKGLKVLQWTLWLFAYRLQQTSAAGSSSHTVSKALRKLYNEVTFTRYLLRFYGLPDALLAFRTGGWTVGSSKFAKFLGSLMALCMVGYYPLEHVAYVKWMLPPSLQSSSSSRKGWHTAESLSAYSCRFWLVYLIAESTQTSLSLWRLYREQEQAIKDNHQSEEASDNNNNEQDDFSVAIRSHQLQLARSLLFTLPCYSWSLPNWDTQPWLPEGTCHGLLWIESVVSMVQAIRSYRIR
eukprot:CAMPEP_0194065296 /NCGR_PEP_ID=MMETSP0009_2-20130614/85353_1 /TAXON_ID=210454 /ORGANISM="Grammatophora oceanica, Strain CCMP 410" /LENGTH=264 /DNA_ID=CAMNT_0038718105 /DNA_START=113 /DNA_END=903 /DNA_ORIENTATION=+